MAGLTRYEPWDLLKQMRKDMDELFSTQFPSIQNNLEGYSSSSWVPAVDVREEDDKYVIHADVPGVDPKDIDVNIDNGVLTIKGEKKHEASDSGKNYKRIERSYGTFFRQFTLPDTADVENIKAKSANGVLELTIPKTTKSASTKKIEVEG